MSWSIHAEGLFVVVHPLERLLANRFVYVLQGLLGIRVALLETILIRMILEVQLIHEHLEIGHLLCCFAICTSLRISGKLTEVACIVLL